MKKRWGKELARDFIALGSVPFFILVIVRIFILSDWTYMSQLLISAGIFLLLMFLLKASLYSGLGFIALFFTSIFYTDLKYTIFASLIYAGLVCSLFYLKKDKKRIIKGIIFGLISSLISYYLINIILGL